MQRYGCDYLEAVINFCVHLKELKLTQFLWQPFRTAQQSCLVVSTSRLARSHKRNGRPETGSGRTCDDTQTAVPPVEYVPAVGPRGHAVRGEHCGDKPQEMSHCSWPPIKQ